MYHITEDIQMELKELINLSLNLNNSLDNGMRAAIVFIIIIKTISLDY